MQPSTIALAAALALSGFQGGPPNGPVVLENCVVGAIEDIDLPADLPAQEAGVLMELQTPRLDAAGQPVLDNGQPVYDKVVEGMQVTQGQVLGRVDDRLARKNEEVARYRLQVAQQEAGNDVSIRYAQKTAEVAKATYDASEEVNLKAAKTIPRIELLRQYLQWEQAGLQTEQAQHEFGIAKVSVNVQQAQLDAAILDVNRREIRSPLDGVIEEVYPREGEWLRPGDPILRIVRMNRLRVEGRLEYSRFSPASVDGQPVVVTAILPGERVATQFPGHIVFASSRMEADGRFKVRAEVDNRKDETTGHWRLLPGLKATMEIQPKR
jgi:macrolide-specific efflux system membrane fusion protein